MGILGGFSGWMGGEGVKGFFCKRNWNGEEEISLMYCVEGGEVWFGDSRWEYSGEIERWGEFWRI